MSSKTLREVANAHLLNIGTADYLVATAIPGGASPGDIINWAIRLDPAALREKFEEFENLDRPKEGSGAYQSLVNGNYFDALNEDWTGLGGDTYTYRWDLFREYVGKDENQGLRRILSGQIAAMADLADGCEVFQDAVEDAIGAHLSGVRSAYVKALVEDGDGAAMTNALSGAGLGAGFGSAGGWPGTLAGAAIGGVMGLIGDFTTDVETKTPEFLGDKVGIIGIGAELKKLERTLVLKDRADGNQVNLDYHKYERKDEELIEVDSWEEGLGGEWESE